MENMNNFGQDAILLIVLLAIVGFVLTRKKK